MYGCIVHLINIRSLQQHYTNRQTRRLWKQANTLTHKSQPHEHPTARTWRVSEKKSLELTLIRSLVLYRPLSVLLFPYTIHVVVFVSQLLTETHVMCIQVLHTRSHAMTITVRRALPSSKSPAYRSHQSRVGSNGALLMPNDVLLPATRR